jgi:hypothetical protein
MILHEGGLPADSHERQRPTGSVEIPDRTLTMLGAASLIQELPAVLRLLDTIAPCGYRGWLAARGFLIGPIAGEAQLTWVSPHLLPVVAFLSI